MRKSHKHFKAVECGLFLHNEFLFIGASTDRILSCSFCLPACLEVKCPYSINYTSPYDSCLNLSYLTRNDDKLQLNRRHKYYTQRLMQRALTGCHKTYFVVWTPQSMVVYEIYFDEELWISMKNKFVQYYMDIYLKTS